MIRALIPTACAHPLLTQALAACAELDPLVVDDSPAGLGLAGLRTSGGLGFARAVNLGLSHLQGEGAQWVLLLNDDAVPQRDCIAQLIHASQNEDNAALLGPLLIGPQGVESAGLRYSPKTARLRQERSVPDGPVDVDALSGACLLMRSELRFDPAFAHAMEDVELSLRVREAGRRVVLIPSARCWHEGGGTLPRGSARAQGAALQGHLRLHRGQPLRQGLAAGYAVGQVLLERGGRDRVHAIAKAWRGRGGSDGPS